MFCRGHSRNYLLYGILGFMSMMMLHPDAVFASEINIDTDSDVLIQDICIDDTDESDDIMITDVSTDDTGIRVDGVQTPEYDLYDLQRHGRNDKNYNNYCLNYYFYGKSNYQHDTSVLDRVYHNKTLKQYLYECVLDCVTDIDISGYQLSISEDAFPFYDVLDAYPELFYINCMPYFNYDTNTKMLTNYHIDYIGTKSEIDVKRQELESAADALAAQVPDYLSDYEKTLVLHDLIDSLCHYSDKDYESETNGYADIKHTSYGCLVNHDAVCDGYSDAYAYVLTSRLGINAETIISTKMNHAWNMVELDGDWYHADLTWDDTICEGIMNHTYFLCSDDSFGKRAHHDWVSDHKAGSDLYEKAFWRNVNSPVQPYHGWWVYAKYDRALNKLVLVKRAGLNQNTEIILKTFQPFKKGNLDRCENYMTVQKYKGRIYVNSRDKLYRLNLDDSISSITKPEMPDDHALYGFHIFGDKFVCSLLESPYSRDSRVFVNVSSGSLFDDTFRVFDYQVGLLSGYSGSYVRDLDLSNFVWESPDKKLVKKGVSVCYASYVPEDVMNYDVIKHVPIYVNVTCPGHSYDRKESKSKIVYTCHYCKDKRVKYKLSGITYQTKSGLLKVSWNNVPDVKRYKAVLYQDNKKLAVRTVTKPAAVFRNLKAGKTYVVKIYGVDSDVVTGKVKIKA